MKIRQFILVCCAVAALTAAAAGQTVVVVDATKTDPEVKLSPAEEKIFNTDALPRAKKKITSETCDGEPEVTGVAHGAFSKAGVRQSLVFYQLCQTGNGLGWVGLILIENGKMIGNWVADSGWSQAVTAVPDINKNGLDEFALSFGGGMHQGEGGVGVDLMEFAGGSPKGIGWFQVQQFDESDDSYVWRVTAKSGPTPIFYRQKFISRGNQKYRRVGTNTVFKLKKTAGGAFGVVK